MFNLLPSLWHGMEPAECRVAMTILESHNFQYTADALQQLHLECHLPFNQLSNIRVCAIVARQHPQTLDTTVSKKITPASVDTTVSEAKAAAAKQSDG